MQLALGVLHIGHVLERDAHLRLVVAARGTFDVAAQEAAAQGIAQPRQQEENEEGDQENGRQDEEDERPDPGARFIFEANDRVSFELLPQIADQLGVDVRLDAVVANVFLEVLLEVLGFLFLEFADDARGAADGDLGEFAVLAELDEIVVAHGAGRGVAEQHPQDAAEEEQHDDPEPAAGHVVKLEK